MKWLVFKVPPRGSEIDERRVRPLERLGGSHIGEDHEFFDQAMRVEPLRRDDPVHRAIRFEQDLAFRQIEVERVACIARGLERPVGGIERLDHIRQQRRGHVVRPAVDCGLRLRVGELCGGAHQHAMKAMRVFAAVGGDDHAHRECRPVLAGSQRAQIVGDALGQHRHDLVGKIDRVAARERFAVECGARPHVVGHIGDRDIDDEAAAVRRVRIGPREHRVIVILGIDRIDGDQRDIAPVFAPLAERCRTRRLRLGQRIATEYGGNFVHLDGDQADGLFARQRT